MQLDIDDVQVIMKLADKDRDGKVSLEDFRNFMTASVFVDDDTDANSRPA